MRSWIVPALCAAEVSHPEGLKGLSPRFQPSFNPGLCTQFCAAGKASLDSVNKYRLEAYATLLFGTSSDVEVMR
jgi:hypothetical protein